MCGPWKCSLAGSVEGELLGFAERGAALANLAPSPGICCKFGGEIGNYISLQLLCRQSKAAGRPEKGGKYMEKREK